MFEGLPCGKLEKNIYILAALIAILQEEGVWDARRIGLC